MGIAITKKGNAYETTSKGKIGAMAIGAGAGGYLASKNVDLIKNTVNDVYTSLITDVGKSAVDVTKSGINGKIDPKVVLDNFKADGKIIKYATKAANFIKKHPVAIGASLGALALVGIGGFIDSISNHYRAKKADLNHK